MTIYSNKLLFCYYIDTTMSLYSIYIGFYNTNNDIIEQRLIVWGLFISPNHGRHIFLILARFR